MVKLYHTTMPCKYNLPSFLQSAVDMPPWQQQNARAHTSFPSMTRNCRISEQDAQSMVEKNTSEKFYRHWTK